MAIIDQFIPEITGIDHSGPGIISPKMDYLDK